MTVPPVSEVVAPSAVSKPPRKVKCVLSGAVATINQPLNVRSVFPLKYWMNTSEPATKGCAAAVVTVTVVPERTIVEMAMVCIPSVVPVEIEVEGDAGV